MSQRKTTLSKQSSKKFGSKRDLLSQSSSKRGRQRQDTSNSLQMTSEQLPQNSQQQSQYTTQNQILSGDIERFLVNLNDQMQQLQIETEMKNAQNEQYMKMQARRIVELQQMGEGMQKEIIDLKQRRAIQWDRNQSLQQGISHLEQLQDFESLSKSIPANQNSLFRDDALNNFINNYNNNNNNNNNSFMSIANNPGSIGLGDIENEFGNMQSMQSYQNQGNSRQQNRNNHFQSAAALALGSSQTQFQQQKQPQQRYSIPQPFQNMQPDQSYRSNQSRQLPQQQKTQELNPVFEKIQKQNDMLAQMVSELDKKPGKKSKPLKKKKKSRYDSSDDSSDSSNYDDLSDSDDEDPNDHERMSLQNKIKQLESQVKQQQLQTIKQFDKHSIDPDIKYLSQAQEKYLQNNNNNPYQNNYPQIPANNNPYPPPEQFLQQIQSNNYAFNSQKPGGNNPFPFPPFAGRGPQERPPFVNPKSTLPPPENLAEIFKNQLLNQLPSYQN